MDFFNHKYIPVVVESLRLDVCPHFSISDDGYTKDYLPDEAGNMSDIGVVLAMKEIREPYLAR